MQRIESEVSSRIRQKEKGGRRVEGGQGGARGDAGAPGSLRGGRTYTAAAIWGWWSTAEGCTIRSVGGGRQA